jgi:hypothetical protein
MSIMSSTEKKLVREPRTVIVTRLDLWALQKAVKINTVLLDPQSMKPMLEEAGVGGRGGDSPDAVSVEGGHAALRLRRKVNSLLLQMAEERCEELPLPLALDEAWYIDSALHAGSYPGAERLLLQVFRVIWEWENELPLSDVEPLDTNIENLREKLAQWRYGGDNGPSSGK